MLTCKQLIEDFLMAYVAGELPVRDRWLFRLHLAGCWACRAYLKSYRATLELGKSSLAEDIELPEPPEELVQAILAASGKQPLDR
jgi:anti-sigma factor RsiW